MAIRFNYNAQTCNDLTPVSFYDIIYGSSLKSIDAFGNLCSLCNIGPLNSDYLLLELNTSLTYLKSIGVCFAGWTLNNPLVYPSTKYAIIHHPKGDFKKITIAESLRPATNGTNFNNPDFYDMDYLSAKGTTEGGSSGAPLFNAFHQIIGTHSGLTPSYADLCQNYQFYKFFGRFFNQWSQGSFKQWLDPLNQTSTSTFGCQTYCPYPAGSTVEIGGPINASSYNPFSSGFNINGKSGFPILCQTDNITLTPVIPGSYFSLKEFNKSVPCSQATDGGGTSSITNNLFSYCSGNTVLTFYTSCSCWFTSYQIFIEEFDYELKPTGNEVSKVFEQKGTGAYQSSLNFNASDVGMSLSPGKFYKIGAGKLTGTWDYSSKVIYILPNDLNINSKTIGANLYAMNNMTLQNITTPIATQFKVEASNKITIKSNSNIKSGHYFISPINCGTFRLITTGDTKGKGNNNIGELEYQSNSGEKNKKSLGDSYSLYPNPATTDVIFELKNNSYLNKDFNIQIYSSMGVLVRSDNTFNYLNLINIKVSDLSSGVYFVRLKTSDKVWDMKFVKE